MSDDVEIKDQGTIKTIRLNRLDKKNAITQDMYSTIADAMDAAQKDGFSAIVFLGQPGVFSSGNDISDFMTNAMSDDFSSSPTLRFLRALATCKIPMIAGVDGLAIGVGTTMLMHCDMVFATKATTLKTPFLDLGLVPEAGSSLIAPLIMGQQRAFELLVMGEKFSADRAHAAGLINHIIEEDALEKRVMEAAQKLTALPPEALRLSRGLLRPNEEEILKRIDQEAALFAERLDSDEAREAFAAFMEKRPPNFNKPDA